MVCTDDERTEHGTIALLSYSILLEETSLQILSFPSNKGSYDSQSQTITSQSQSQSDPFGHIRSWPLRTYVHVRRT